MKIDCIEIGLTPKQLQRRRGFFNASDAPDIMSGQRIEQRYLTAIGEREPDDLSDNLAVVMGSWTEALNAHWFTMTTGEEVTARGREIERDWLRCTLDGMTLHNNLPAVWEGKHVSLGWQSRSVDEVIAEKAAYYMPQVHIQMHLAGVECAVLCIFLNQNTGITHHIIPVPFDPIYWIDVERTCLDFWTCVQMKTPPAGIEPVEAPALPSEFRTVDMTGNNEWAAAASDFLENKAAAKTFEAAKKAIKGLLESDVGLAEGYGVRAKRGKTNRITIGESK
jgi:hypothetical protein